MSRWHVDKLQLLVGCPAQPANYRSLKALIISFCGFLLLPPVRAAQIGVL